MTAWMQLIHPYFVVPTAGIYSHVRSFKIGLVETKKVQRPITKTAKKIVFFLNEGDGKSELTVKVMEGG